MRVPYCIGDLRGDPNLDNYPYGLVNPEPSSPTASNFGFRGLQEVG